ncbi:uncharacterized protein LOC134192784 [Corticium candelabrum]|uniref:uncharacterized protein LOC134192784 n=1 Tax=Corticium candelabrum TaxID=121492 RepID=UPI002E254CD9|nr:uncharacterized protein LOC134192784 [Corticium candelabrum]
MSAAKGFFDQYSVLCVFGSVVGCVIVPLITQSFESLIFSAVVITLTANRLSRRVLVNEQHVKSHVKDVERMAKRSAETIHGTKKKRKGTVVTQQVPVSLDAEEVRKRREEEIRNTEEERKRELEKREEEKKEKKARKKQERNRRKEQEKLLKEKEEEERQRRSFERAQRRLANTTATAELELFYKPDGLFATTVKRASSTSSIASNCSNISSHSSPHSPTNCTARSRPSGNSSLKSPTATSWFAAKPAIRPYSVSYDDSGRTITACAKPNKRPFERGSSAPNVISNSTCWQYGNSNEAFININQQIPRHEALPENVCLQQSTEDITHMAVMSVASSLSHPVPLRHMNSLSYHTGGLGNAHDANCRLYSFIGEGNVAPPAFGPLVQPCGGHGNHVPQQIV